ncbi:uncharacterized protein LOC114938791 [Nylanderia fulva]|uniref:uncharacterized protein LOC114938791 n=1 Tax=Nylanderia fulva TaxID=613905 RepID=UPI0010FAF7B2|nr:uncharacterized protein LOC114938791 [Nylanderia fulva]
MTLKSLINFGNFGKAPWDTSIERYHSDEGGYHHRSSKGKSGNNVALSALTLLAFLFLLNVMQQSLQDNNSTLVPPTTALLLRDTEMPIVLDNGEEKDTKTKDNFADEIANTYGSRTTIKGYA